MRKLVELYIAFMLMASELHWRYIGKRKFDTEYRRKLITDTKHQDAWNKLFPSTPKH